MKVIVDMNLCESHGQCVLAAGDVFQLEDDMILHYDPEPADERRSAVEEAVVMCPTQAIRIDS